MIVSRTVDILEAIDQKREPSFTQDELQELEASLLIETITPGEKGIMQRSLLDLDRLAQKIRSMTRDRNLSQQRIAPLDGLSVSGAVDSSMEYQRALADLEDLVGTKSRLDSFVDCPGMGCGVALTSSGRKALADLSVWSGRFGSQPTGIILARLNEMRTEMEYSVHKASIFVDECQESGLILYLSALRGPALVLADTNPNPQAFSKLFYRSKHLKMHDEKYDLLVPTFMLSSGRVERDSMKSCQDALRSVQESNLSSQDDAAKIVTLVSLPPDDPTKIIDRMKWIQSNISPPDGADVAWLARADYPLDVLKERYSGLMSEMVKNGFKEDDDLKSACAIMAGADFEVGILLDRWKRLLDQLGPSFERPQVAAALLATKHLEPNESLFVFREAVGAISRASFFDDIHEIDALAILMTSKVSVKLDSTAQVEAAGEEANESMRQSLPAWYYWYAWNHHYYYNPTIVYIRQHPGHMHTAQYFG